MKTHAHPSLSSPGVLSVLPIFYVAWADGILSPTEMQTLHAHLDSYGFLTQQDRSYLRQYTNPQEPPSPEIFGQWADFIEKYSSQLPPTKRSSLAQFGRDLALSLSTDPDRKTWISPKTLESIQELEIMLGVNNPESQKLLLDRFLTTEDIWMDRSDSDFPRQELYQYLEGDDHQTREQLRTLLSDPQFRHAYSPVKEEYRAQVLDQCKELARQGYGLFALPDYIGGQSDMSHYASVFELLAHFDGSLSVKFGVQFGLYALSIQHLGSPRQHKQFLRDAATMTTLGCFAMTEIGHGSNVRDLQTTAHYDATSQTWVIHTPHPEATKEYIGNALYADQAVVFAQLYVDDTCHGVHAFVVPLRDESGADLPGIHREDSGYKLGLNGVDNGRLSFNQVRIPRDYLLERYGSVDAQGRYHSEITKDSKRFFTMLGTLVGGRICVARAGLASAKNALTIAIRYAHRRRQFRSSTEAQETLLIDYPSHQKRLLPLLAKAYGYHFALHNITRQYIRQTQSSQRIESEAAGLKAKTTWLANDIIQECREACGGAGYMRSSGIPRLRKDADIFATFEGDNTVLMQLVAKSLLSEFKQRFHDEGFSAVFRFLMRRASTAITEQNLIQRRKTDASHLLDPDFHREAFRFREKHHLHTVSQRMRQYLSMKVSPYEAFLRCQNHMIALAHAHVDRYVLTCFHRAIHEAPDATRPVLTLLCEVYALSILDGEKAYFLEHGYMEGRKTKAIRRILNQRLYALKGQALPLVEVWGIPDSFLQSDIATMDSEEALVDPAI